jgi:hypothetical protein
LKDIVFSTSIEHLKIFKKCSAILSTVSSEMAKKVPNGVRKSICRNG